LIKKRDFLPISLYRGRRDRLLEMMPNLTALPMPLSTSGRICIRGLPRDSHRHCCREGLGIPQAKLKTQNYSDQLKTQNSKLLTMPQAALQISFNHLENPDHFVEKPSDLTQVD
jgi:hypothetical protein